MFNNRPIIVGVLTLGYATLGLVFSWTAGLLVAQGGTSSRAPGRPCWRAAVGGAFGGSVVAILPIAMSLINLRIDFRRPRLAASTTF